MAENIISINSKVVYSKFLKLISWILLVKVLSFLKDEEKTKIDENNNIIIVLSKS